MIEIERKFLVKSGFIPEAGQKMDIRQGYLSTDPGRVVRVRCQGDKAWIAIKGKREGISRTEYEYPVPVDDALKILQLAIHPPVEKTRYLIEEGGLTWEVDRFHGMNEGLVLAEIELDDESMRFDLPEWIGEEVTSDHRYYNAWLSEHPFKTWVLPDHPLCSRVR